MLGMALLNVPILMSTVSVGKPKCSSMPCPVAPSTPIECASSTISIASYFRHSRLTSGRSMMSPSMLNTASTMTSRFPGCVGSFRQDSRWPMSLCRKRTNLAPDNWQPSTMLAWLSLSQMTVSFRPTKQAMVDTLAKNPLEKVAAASVPLNRATTASNSLCRSSVPASIRTPNVPVPYLSIACIEAALIVG